MFGRQKAIKMIKAIKITTTIGIVIARSFFNLALLVLPLSWIPAISAQAEKIPPTITEISRKSFVNSK